MAGRPRKHRSHPKPSPGGRPTPARPGLGPLDRAADLHRAGRLDEAEAIYLRLLDDGSDDVRVLQNLGALRRRQGRLEDAVALYERGLAVAPDHHGLNHNLANALNALGEYARAEPHYRQALAALPDNADLLAGLGLSLVHTEKADEAAAVCRRAIAIDPRAVRAHRHLAMALDRLGRADEATAAYRRVLELDPDDAAIRHLLTARLGEQVPTAPTAYVQSLFDGYAAHFEKDLVGKLGYRTPQLLRDLLKEHGAGGRRFTAAVDLGCGTGLMGEILKPWCDRLEGVDLSAKMIEQARAKGVYDRLEVGDIVAFLAAAETGFDLATAADVLVYIGDLAPIFAAVAATLRPGGLFVFSTEALAEGEWLLERSGRYRHSHAYVERQAAAVGLAVVAHTSATIRREYREPVAGGLYIAEKPQPAAAVTPAAPTDTAPPDAGLDDAGPDDTIAPEFDDAVALHQADRLAEAEAIYRGILTRAPDDRRVLQNLGVLCWRQGRRDEALRLYERALATAPGDPALNAWIGGALFTLKDYDRAELHLRRALARRADDLRLVLRLASLLDERNMAEEAEELFRRAIQIAPGEAAAHRGLADFLCGRGRAIEATASFRRVVELDPADKIAAYMLAAGEGRKLSETPPEFVERFSDAIAASFETVHVDRLNYQLQQQLLDLLDAELGAARRFGRVLDLGCGTGLMGAKLRRRCDVLHGLDLSTAMLDQARAKGIYDDLTCGEIVASLRGGAGAYDLMTAADVLVYSGDLSEVFAAAASRLTAGGLLLFSTEALACGSWQLTPIGRFAHDPGYVQACGEGAGLELVRRTTVAIPREGGCTLAGGLYLLRRRT
ncbi:MAG: tetratricopeptide repeat protein [Defluviicoccus sp.]|nr:tetratricopeptide repeat protein [Defluviicoccus sp.]